MNDGICDCCDGADEPPRSRCPNTCSSTLDEHRLAAQTRLEDITTGFDARKRALKKVEMKKTAIREEIRQMKHRITELETFQVTVRRFQRFEDKIEYQMQVDAKTRQDSIETCDETMEACMSPWSQVHAAEEDPEPTHADDNWMTYPIRLTNGSVVCSCTSIHNGAFSLPDPLDSLSALF